MGCAVDSGGWQKRGGTVQWREAESRQDTSIGVLARGGTHIASQLLYTTITLLRVRAGNTTLTRMWTAGLRRVYGCGTAAEARQRQAEEEHQWS